MLDAKLQSERSSAAKAAAAAESPAALQRSRVAQLRGTLEVAATHCFPHPASSTSSSMSSDTATAAAPAQLQIGAPAASGSSRGPVPTLPLGQIAGQAALSGLDSSAAAGAGMLPVQPHAAGERWLYQHAPGGVWWRIKSLLAQPEAHDNGLSSLTSSGECVRVEGALAPSGVRQQAGKLASSCLKRCLLLHTYRR
jgi:hypothetical protein